MRVLVPLLPLIIMLLKVIKGYRTWLSVRAIRSFSDSNSGVFIPIAYYGECFARSASTFSFEHFRRIGLDLFLLVWSPCASSSSPGSIHKRQSTTSFKYAAQAKVDFPFAQYAATASGWGEVAPLFACNAYFLLVTFYPVE